VPDDVLIRGLSIFNHQFIDIKADHDFVAASAERK
jgi:hypothetical protein